MLLSVGERISTALLSIAICDLGLSAVSFTGSQSGIITNTRHNRARIIEIRPYRLMDALDVGNVVIVAGYKGVIERSDARSRRHGHDRSRARGGIGRGIL